MNHSKNTERKLMIENYLIDFDTGIFKKIGEEDNSSYAKVHVVTVDPTPYEELDFDDPQEDFEISDEFHCDQEELFDMFGQYKGGSDE